MKKIGSVLAVLMAAVILVSTGCKKEPPAATEIVVEIFDRGTDGGRSLPYDNAWTNWVKEKLKKDLNIDITYLPVGRWSEQTDLSNLMASQSAPDLCYTYSTDMIGAFRDQGGVLDFSPHIDKYLPDLKKLLGEDPVFKGKDFIYRNADPQTGKIYSIPSYRVALAQRNVFIRKDWLDATGLALPKSIDELHNALVVFRDRDPGNVGKNNVVPFLTSDVQWGLGTLIRHSVDANISDRDRWVLSVHERNIMMPGYKEGVRRMNQWFNEGLIYPDWPLLKGEDANNLLKRGVVGAICANWDTPYRTDSLINEELAKNVPGAEFVPLDLAVNNKDMMDKVGLQIFIPIFSKNYVAALQYLNWLAKPENYHFLQVGQEGVNHVLENGVPRVIAATGSWIQNSPQNIDMTMPMNGVEMGSQELNSRVLALSYGNTPAETIINAYALSVKNARAAAVYQATTKVNQYAQTLQDKADALSAQAIRATPAQFDSVWDEGIKDWLISGGQEVINERSSLYK